jgi:micrococcal nuclease
MACGPETQISRGERPREVARENSGRGDFSAERSAERTTKRKAERRVERRAARRTKAKRQKTALVARVVDGDTIELLFHGAIVDVRVIGIDTSETVHPTEPLECYGRAASGFTTRSLQDDRVRLEFDDERRDQYGRVLAYIWDDGKLFNRVLVAKGFATVTTYPPNVRYVDRFVSAQRRARGAERGLWGSCGAGSEGQQDDRVAL